MHSVKNWYFYLNEDLDLNNTPQEIDQLKNIALQTASYIVIMLFSMQTLLISNKY